MKVLLPLLWLLLGARAFSPPSIHLQQQLRSSTPPRSSYATSYLSASAASHPARRARRCGFRDGLALKSMIDPIALEGAAVSAWSVTSYSDDLAAALFQSSLFPYLTFLFFLSRPEVKAPPGTFFGFAFLLVFVAATIPAGIYAKVAYHDILANIDYLHLSAESLLTVTNFFVVKAFRSALVTSGQGKQGGDRPDEVRLFSGAGASLVVIAVAAASSGLFLHAEPTNALSYPTWMVHVSSLLEWLAAMTLVWKYAATSGREEWKGLTWGMLPLHSSGLCACTYHIFYNSPDVVALVGIQAALTCFGNSTMAFALWRIWRAGLTSAEKGITPHISDTAAGERRAELGDGEFYGKIVAYTVIGAALVKWGELLFDFPFEPSYSAAAAVILIPTALNIAKWVVRSHEADGGLDEDMELL